ncbi:GINS complex subunit [Geranomyces michiganensis]|nr:GINS complex subunit [Geranomyces michiganensis]
MSAGLASLEVPLFRLIALWTKAMLASDPPTSPTVMDTDRDAGDSFSEQPSSSAFTFSLDDGGGHLNPNDDDDLDGYFNDDIKSLTQCWINERCAPELLPYADDLVRGLMEMIEAQAANIEARRDGEAMGPSPDAAFLAVLLQQEIERIKFLIRSYLRARLAKIQRHTQHILREELYRSRLSPEELAFAERFQELLTKHFKKSYLDDLPAFLQKLDGVGMVSTPDLEDAVFCRVKEDIGGFQLESSDEILTMRTNNIYFLRYNAIRRLMEDGKVELI